mmetsp:Transcript_31874/g.51465  ORF Transcript_31874/g.51465 Transcript_31874/m.51465 type:complete len:252 (+) Transcript_31874:610-1365(+)
MNGNASLCANFHHKRLLERHVTVTWLTIKNAHGWQARGVRGGHRCGVARQSPRGQILRDFPALFLRVNGRHMHRHLLLHSVRPRMPCAQDARDDNGMFCGCNCENNAVRTLFDGTLRGQGDGTVEGCVEEPRHGAPHIFQLFLSDCQLPFFSCHRARKNFSGAMLYLKFVQCCSARVANRSRMRPSPPLGNRLNLTGGPATGQHIERVTPHCFTLTKLALVCRQLALFDPCATCQFIVRAQQLSHVFAHSI